MFYKCKTCGFICDESFKNCPSCGTDSGQIDIKKELFPKNKINFITCDSGDWEILKLNEEVFAEGHKIDSYSWIKLLEKIFNIKTEHKNISDEDMENSNY